MEDEAAPPPAGVVLIPGPGVAPDVASEIARRLSRRVALPCRAAAAVLPAPPRLAHRDQVDADAFLRQAEALPRRPGHLLVALTADDMAHPVFTFFFGRARRGGDSVVVSLARLTPAFYGLPDDRETTLRRAVQEVLHEIGHALGLGHCPDAGCVMRFSSSVEALDTRGTGWCAACRAGLPRAVAIA